MIQIGKYISPYYLTLLVIFILLPPLPALTGQKISNNFQRPPTQNPYRIKNITYYPIPSSSGYVETGIASWYGSDFHGRPTSNGETYNMYQPTAAHKLLPMNTMLLVANLENGNKTIVRINDRGPFIRGRIIDLSYNAAKKLNLLNNGTAKVRITALAPGHKSLDGKKIEMAQYDFDKGEYYVQIGSFRSKGNALHLQRRFTDAGHTTVIQKYFHPDSIFYRVQVYVGTHLHGAKKAEKILLKNGYKGAFIIAR